MTGRDKPRDWDKELAEVDRLIAAGAGAPPTPAPTRSGAPAPDPGSPGRPALATWLRLALGVGLGVAMTQWPYVHGCGVALFGYLAAAGTVCVAGAWTMVSSWRSRSARAHVLSLGLVFWGVALVAREVLPRIGYARQAATWWCGP